MSFKLLQLIDTLWLNNQGLNHHRKNYFLISLPETVRKLLRFKS